MAVCRNPTSEGSQAAKLSVQVAVKFNRVLKRAAKSHRARTRRRRDARYYRRSYKGEAAGSGGLVPVGSLKMRRKLAANVGRRLWGDAWARANEARACAMECPYGDYE